MKTRDQSDPWAAIAEDLRRLQSEEPAEVEECGERIPCPDESCLGTLGEDGLCRLCGMGTRACLEPEQGSWALEEEPERPSQLRSGEDEELKEERVCCSDESCVGTVDEEGYCRICGLKWKQGGYLEGESLLYRQDTLS